MGLSEKWGNGGYPPQNKFNNGENDNKPLDFRVPYFHSNPYEATARNCKSDYLLESDLRAIDFWSMVSTPLTINCSVPASKKYWSFWIFMRNNKEHKVHFKAQAADSFYV